MSKAIVVRYGAYGDAVMTSPIYRLLKKDGYKVIANVNKRCQTVLMNNPYIDDFKIHNEAIPNEALTAHWEVMKMGCDRFINLTGSIETGLLKLEGGEEYLLPHDERHASCNVNYYDRTLELAGYPEVKGKNGELYFSRIECEAAQKYRKQYKGKFMVLWSMSGSSYHKAYPWAEYVAQTLLQSFPDMVIVTVGGPLDLLIEFDHPRAIKKADVWPIRRSMLMTKYADCVVATETAIANASGCFDTPKVILLSHSSEENLTKYWKNCISLRADVPCQPCHQLHYTLESCPLDAKTVAPACMAQLKADSVLKSIEGIYKAWKDRRAAA